MPRERLRPGKWGKITVRQTGPNKFTATTYFRDVDGERREVERSGASREAAERNLKDHLEQRVAPLAGAIVDDKTTLAELFDAWIGSKTGITEQSADLYRQVWNLHGKRQIGKLRIREFPTSRAERLLSNLGAEKASTSDTMRTVMKGMLALAVRCDVIATNPIREVSRAPSKRKPTRALTAAEFQRARAAVVEYNQRPGVSGPAPGRLLLAFIDVLMSTGARPNEVLAIRWHEVDLLGSPPTAEITGKLVDHGRIKGKPVHRQDFRKGDAPAHTVVLPRLAVQALTSLVGDSDLAGMVAERGKDQPVFANRDGGWMSLANLRRSLRAALPEDLRWIQFKSFRPTVATVVRDGLGPAEAQAQLSHAKLSTTEAHYFERHTHGPDVRATLDDFTGNVGDENTGKVRDSG